MKILKHLPNLLTCCNVLCGAIGIIFVFENNFEYATYMVWIGALFDFSDGLVARLLKASSVIGKELDSLADMVTFGALPGFFVFQLIKPQNELLAYVSLLIIAFSALRLAKFNIDTRQSENFIGLPTPANALFITALPFLAEINVFSDVLNPVALIVTSLIFAFLLVSEIPLLSLKFKDFSFRNNLFRYVLIVLCVLSLAFFGLKAISLTVIIYLLISLLWNLISKQAVTIEV